ncbi:MAG: hypothetical protein DRP82_03475 [Planctomycetota bacterium]|nr:MAG: hypothetical protein DRP82_03475 [Planctomycetota bacterium]
MRRCLLVGGVFVCAMMLFAQQKERFLFEPKVGSNWRVTISAETDFVQNGIFWSYRVRGRERFVVEGRVSDRIVRGGRVEYQVRIIFKEAVVEQEVVWRQSGWGEVWHKRWRYELGGDVPEDMEWFDEAVRKGGKICVWRTGEPIGETNQILWAYLMRVPYLPRQGVCEGDKWRWKFDLSSVLARIVLKAKNHVSKDKNGLLIRQIYDGCEIGKTGKAGKIDVRLRFVKGALSGEWRLRREAFLPTGWFRAQLAIDALRCGGTVAVEPARVELRTRYECRLKRLNR